MKILYSHRTKSADGQYVHIEALISALVAAGHHLTICGPEGEMTPKEALQRKMNAGAGERKGLTARLPKAVYELAELFYSVPAWWRLYNAYRRHRPEIIYERYNLYFLAGLWLKQAAGLKLILEVNAPLREERAKHGGIALEGLARWAERRVWRSADAVLPVTRALAEKLMAEGVDPKRIHVVPNGIHTEEYTHADSADIRAKFGLQGRTVLGFTGFVRDWHGVDLILEYLSERADPELHLLLVGDGPHLPHLKQRAAACGIEDRITFCGVIQRPDLPAYTATFDIALQPRATAYASPLKLFEYMAAGKAIIAPNQGNIQEVLQDSQNALLFDPDDKRSLFAALDTLVDNPSMRRELGAQAQKTIIDCDLTWAANAARILKIAETLTSEHKDDRNGDGPTT